MTFKESNEPKPRESPLKSITVPGEKPKLPAEMKTRSSVDVVLEKEIDPEKFKDSLEAKRNEA